MNVKASSETATAAGYVYVTTLGQLANTRTGEAC